MACRSCQKKKTAKTGNTVRNYSTFFQLVVLEINKSRIAEEKGETPLIPKEVRDLLLSFKEKANV